MSWAIALGCRKCGCDLKQFSLGDSIGIFPNFAFYCPSGTCELGGFLLIGNPVAKEPAAADGPSGFPDIAEAPHA